MEKYSFYLPYHTYNKWKKILGYPKLDKERDNKIDILIQFIMSRNPRLYCTAKSLQLYPNQITLSEQMIKLFAKPKMVTICIMLRQMGLITDIINYIINEIPLLYHK